MRIDLHAQEVQVQGTGHAHGLAATGCCRDANDLATCGLRHVQQDAAHTDLAGQHREAHGGARAIAQHQGLGGAAGGCVQAGCQLDVDLAGVSARGHDHVISLAVLEARNGACIGTRASVIHDGVARFQLRGAGLVEGDDVGTILGQFHLAGHHLGADLAQRLAATTAVAREDHRRTTAHSRQADGLVFADPGDRVGVTAGQTTHRRPTLGVIHHDIARLEAMRAADADLGGRVAGHRSVELEGVVHIDLGEALHVTCGGDVQAHAIQCVVGAAGQADVRVVNLDHVIALANHQARDGRGAALIHQLVASGPVVFGGKSDLVLTAIGLDRGGGRNGDRPGRRRIAAARGGQGVVKARQHANAAGGRHMGGIHPGRDGTALGRAARIDRGRGHLGARRSTAIAAGQRGVVEADEVGVEGAVATHEVVGQRGTDADTCGAHTHGQGNGRHGGRFTGHHIDIAHRGLHIRAIGNVGVNLVGDRVDGEGPCPAHRLATTARSGDHDHHGRGRGFDVDIARLGLDLGLVHVSRDAIGHTVVADGCAHTGRA